MEKIVKKGKRSIVLYLMLLVFLGFIAFLIYTSLKSEKLVCKSEKAMITLMYNDDGLTGYTAKGVSFEEKEAKEYIKQVGIKQYIEEFKNSFVYYYGGTCK